MAVFEHGLSLNICVKTPQENFEDVDPDIIIAALEKRITKMQQNKKAWADYVEHYLTEDVTKYQKDET
jgi:hypothetical protein